MTGYVIIQVLRVFQPESSTLHATLARVEARRFVCIKIKHVIQFLFNDFSVKLFNINTEL